MANVYAEVAQATGWTIDYIGTLTFRQLDEFLPALNEAITGEENSGPGMDYEEACRIAGVEDRIAK